MMNVNKRQAKSGVWAALLAFALVLLFTASAMAADLSGSYSWKPVKIGAGGWMQGMVIHPTNSAVKYARGDVDNIYRWDNTNSVWIPIEVSSALPANVVADPVDAFPGPIAVDPSNSNVVLCTWTFNRSADTEASHPSLPMSVYRSTNGGLSFVASNLSLTGELSQEHRGERMAIDPNNGNVVYFGSPNQGLWRSMDGGLTWANVTANGAPAATAAAFIPRFDGGAGTVVFSGQTVSRRVYVSVDGGSVLKSDDGGNTWVNITNAGQNECDGHPEYMTVDQTGRLMIVNGGNDHIDVYSRAGVWSQMVTPHNLAGFAVDPNNSGRIFGMGQGGNLSRTTNNGVNWTDLGGSLKFSTTQEIQWLRPSASRPQGHAVSTSGMYMDSGGKLWCPAANDGIITCVPNDATDTLANPPIWSSQSQGIEEMVAQHLTIPPGGNPVCMVEDESFFTIFNPDLFTAQHSPFDTWTGGSGLAIGMDVAYCWNQPHYIVETAENAPQNGHRFSGYSTDGGSTWIKFTSINNLTHPCVLYDGAIAVAPRLAGHQNDGPGGDMIVWSPTKANSGTVPAPFYSTDGGATWTQTHAFDSLPGALLNVQQCGVGNGSFTYMPDGFTGDWGIYIHQHELEADAINRGTFYWDTTVLGFWKTTDGGVNWTQMAGNGLPKYTHHGQLQSNPYTSGDLWLAGGFEGSVPVGLYHTTDSGNNWTRSTAFNHAWELALGKSLNVGGYPTIFVYGQLSTDPLWGVFRSTDQGVTWDRISYYPLGLIDFPSSSAASWDTFGQVYIGFQGNSFCYGTPSGPPPVPNPPTGLTATAGNTQITLNWISSPNATSYSVYRGTATNGENATAIASGIAGLTYTNTGLTNGTTYFYKVTATDVSGTSGYSNEASAVPATQAPPAPANPIAISGDTQITLTWSAAAGATSYNIYRSTTANGETLLVSGVATTSYTNVGLTNGTTYYYKVAGVNATGTGAQSVEAANKPSAANAQIPLASTAPTIDGTVDTVWAGATSYPMSNVTGTIPAGATNSGSWQALWDSTNLYVLVSMLDSTVVSGNDSVEVYIEGNNAKGGAYNSVTWQWVFINGGGIQEYQTGNSGSNTTGMVKADGALAGGWRMEAKIPWTTIGVPGIASDNIGIDVVYNNYNVVGTRANKLFWWSTTDNDWTNPGLFGTAKLMPASGGIPAAPTGLTATPGNAQVALTWGASGGATSYNVLRSTVSGSGYVSVATGIASTNYTNTGLTNGTTYYFVVTATNSFGTSGNSAQASATPLAPPAAPTGLTATAGNAQVALSWTASGGATSYNVKRSTVSGSGYAQVANVATTSYTNTGLTNGTTYYFVVTALNAGGESGNSNQASATPQVAIPPAPTGLTATAGNAQVALTWNASAGATTYNVSRSTVSGSGYASVATGIATTSYTNTGLTNGTTYYFVVSATNAAGTSANSAQASATPTVSGDTTQYNFEAGIQGWAASGLTGLSVASSTTRAFLGTHSLALTFASSPAGTAEISIGSPNPTTPAGATVTYHVWIPSGTPITSVKAYVLGGAYVSTSYAIASLTLNAWNTLSVTVPASGVAPLGSLGIDFTTSAAYSGTIYADSVDWPAGSAPPAPTGLTAAPGNAQVALSWTASSGATSYNVLRSTVSGSGYASVATGIVPTSYTNTGLTNGTTYYFVVSATNANGTSANSAQASATPVTAPAAPTGLIATPGNAQVALTWNASSGATTYNLLRSTVSGSGYANVVSQAGTSYTNTGLTNGTTYYFVVTATNAGGTSPNSAQASATPSAGNTHAGTWACKAVLTTTPTYNNLDQTVTTPASTAYVGSFWLKGSGKVTFRAFMGSGTLLGQQTFTATSTWTQCSFSFNTGASTSTKFNITDDGGVAGTCYIDDCFMGVSGQTNVLGNVGFESGNTVWSAQNPPFTIVQNP